MKLLASNQVEENIYDLEIRVEGEEFSAAWERSFKKNAAKVNVPGFRKGKAPKAMILKRAGEAYFFDDAIDETYPAAYEAALEEARLEPVDRAKVELSEISRQGYTFKARVTVYPEVKISDYKGLSATKEVPEATDEEVENQLSQMAEKNSRMITVEDRSAQEGDIAVIDFEGFVDGVAFEGGKGENHNLTLGSGQFIPGFESQVVGHKPEEEFDINVTFPEEYHAENLKGKAAVFKVKLHELKKKELPALDDEFAKDVSEFDTLEELKSDIKAKILEQKMLHAEEHFENQLVEAAAAKMEANIPQVMFDRKTDELVQDFAYRLQGQGINLESYLQYSGTTMEVFKTTFAARAEAQVRGTMALKKIAQLENIQISEEDIEAEFQRNADTYGIPVEQVKTVLPRQNIIDGLSMNKAIDFLKEYAVVIAGEKSAEKKTTDDNADKAKAPKKVASKSKKTKEFTE